LTSSPEQQQQQNNNNNNNTNYNNNKQNSRPTVHFLASFVSVISFVKNYYHFEVAYAQQLVDMTTALVAPPPYA